jgi:hypothetical protein
MSMTTLGGTTDADVAAGVGVLRVEGTGVAVSLLVEPVPQPASTAEIASATSVLSALNAARRCGDPVAVAITGRRSSTPIFTGCRFAAPVELFTVRCIAGAPCLVPLKAALVWRDVAAQV